MSASPPMIYRSHTCGELRLEDEGETVVLQGWVDTRRDLGGVVFIDLRDRYGLTQVVFSPQDEVTAHQEADSLRSEDVITVCGVIRRRDEENINPKLPTGHIEVRVKELQILNRAETLPFSVSSHEEKHKLANEDLRLRYRYLDLRRPSLQQHLITRHHFYQVVRNYFSRYDFVEVETPVLMKSTPEGARDYLVPSRVQAGKFYALPQSPQTYKQLLMIAGMDRYFQIVKCFRDEDLRADRQPEFTQVDVEISFAHEELVYEMIEGLMAAVWQEEKGVQLQRPFPRMSYDDAMLQYGSDKPDRRFGLKLHDISGVFEDSPFRVFQQVLDRDGRIMGMRVPGEARRGRAQMDKLDKEVVRRRIGAAGLVYFKVPADGSETYSSLKASVLPEAFVDAAVDAVGGKAGDLVLVLAGQSPKVLEQMGALRLHMGRELGLIPERGAGPWEFLWVTDFPLLEFDHNEERWVAMHHPFTSPKPDHMQLLDDRPESAKARAYDLVLNGSEIGGGSIRIHERDVQAKMFRLLGIDEEEARHRFGFLLDAFRYGAPPHGGIALGLDRIVMLLSGADSLRDVIAFPKTQSAQEVMVSSPDEVDPRQLKDLHIRLVPAEDAK